MGNYNSSAVPLTALTSIKKPFIWSPEAYTAFWMLKEAFTSDPILQIPDPALQFVVRWIQLTSGWEWFCHKESFYMGSSTPMFPVVPHFYGLWSSLLMWVEYTHNSPIQCLATSLLFYHLNADVSCPSALAYICQCRQMWALTQVALLRSVGRYTSQANHRQTQT